MLISKMYKLRLKSVIFHEKKSTQQHTFLNNPKLVVEKRIYSSVFIEQPENSFSDNVITATAKLGLRKHC